jgi:hypothetical protein
MTGAKHICIVSPHSRLLWRWFGRCCRGDWSFQHRDRSPRLRQLRTQQRNLSIDGWYFYSMWNFTQLRLCADHLCRPSVGQL